MEWIQVVVVILSAAGFWKLLETVVSAVQGRKVKRATAANLEAQTEVQVVGNWIQWAQHLEQRVKELEAVAEENKLLTATVEQQRKRIAHLEAEVKELKRKNTALKRQITALKGRGANKKNSEKKG